MQIRDALESLVNEAIASAIASGALNISSAPEAALERPRDPENGDWASTVALRCSKAAKANPREVAQAIVDAMPENSLVSEVSLAGPGFINFRLSHATLQGVINAVRTQREQYGWGEVPEAKRKINLEYISANPTGPMHIGHGRWAALGDSMARLLRHAGYDVDEEFYVNDHGTQMDVFGESLAVRYMQELGHDVALPEECYGGHYMVDLAKEIIAKDGRKYEFMTDDERRIALREVGYEAMLESQRSLLEHFGTTFNTWFSERWLYVPDDSGQTAVDKALEAMTAKGYVYEKDGATWFASTEFGDDKDRVLIKANGELTYFMSDMAYHYNKLQRGFDQLIDIWGADHHGYIKRCEAMMDAWGAPGKLEIVLGQLVNLLRGGKPVRMSKRTGEMVTFEELIEEVGVDATRYLMLSRSSDQMIDFDIEVAKKQDSSNPVYYVQYAHARICSLLRKAAGTEEGTADNLAETLIPDAVDLSGLRDESELALMRKLDDFSELIFLAARDRAPFRLTHYAQELASLFHQFYSQCRIVDQQEPLRSARLALADATRLVLALTLSLLGVSAPERM